MVVLLKYIEEMYVRLLYILYTLLTCLVSFFAYREEYLTMYVFSIAGEKIKGSFIYTGLGEVFYSYMWLCIFLSCLITVWIIVLNIYLFIVAGLHREEANRVGKVFILSLTSFVVAFGFIHRYILGLVCNYLAGYGNISDFVGVSLYFEPRLKEFILFTLKLDLVLLLVFISFLILFIGIALGAISGVSSIIRTWVYSIIIIVVVIIFPADMLLHILVVSVLLIMFESCYYILCLWKNYMKRSNYSKRFMVK